MPSTNNIVERLERQLEVKELLGLKLNHLSLDWHYDWVVSLCGYQGTIFVAGGTSKEERKKEKHEIRDYFNKNKTVSPIKTLLYYA